MSILLSPGRISRAPDRSLTILVSAVPPRRRSRRHSPAGGQKTPLDPSCPPRRRGAVMRLDNANGGRGVVVTGATWVGDWDAHRGTLEWGNYGDRKRTLGC